MAQINSIPVYNATLLDEESGMIRISLVDDPAVMSNFMAFAEDQHPMMLAVQNEDKRLAVGVVARADFPIYRYSPDMGEYYIVFTAETIRQMATKYLAENRTGRVDLGHDGNERKGIEMVQWFIKDTAMGINPAGFDDVRDGSLFAEYHILRDDVWAAIKSGKYRGFSLEGAFGLEAEASQAKVDEMTTGQNGQFAKHKNMGKIINFLKAAAIKTMAFATVPTDNGILEWDGDDDLKEGYDVYILPETGDRQPAADGEYKTDDGKVITVKDGKVVSIVDPLAEVDDEPMPVEDAPMPDDRFAGIETKIGEMLESINELEAKVKKVCGDVETMAKQPATEQLHKVVTDPMPQATGRMASIASGFRAASERKK